MSLEQVYVRAPSRLHFGLLSFGHPDRRQFGGAGVMIDRPGVELVITHAERLSIAGPLTQRVQDFVDRYCHARGLQHQPACRITVACGPPEHVGLGLGTQLGLAVAAGLDRWFERGISDPATLAAAVGRGQRSAIGTYGFLHGGLIVEGGKQPGSTLSPLVGRFDLPAEWRFVLLIDRATRGLAGAAERQAFAELPPVDLLATAQLCRELLTHLLPAAAEAKFEEFSDSLSRYARQAGLLFASRQGGVYANLRVAEMVEWLRGQGIRAVGQSSWGPTLFALVDAEGAAHELVAAVGRRADSASWAVHVAAVNNRGADIQAN